MYGGTASEDDFEFADLQKKVPNLKRDELVIGRGVTRVRTIPCEAPWSGPMGACLIMITDIRRGKKGKVEFQLGDEKSKPYEKDGKLVWIGADDFPDEWPD